MQRIYTGTQVRRAEAPQLEAGYGRQLMRTAAWGLAHHTRQFLADRGSVYGRHAVGLVGKGNNGGDTLWALSFLADRGMNISAVAIKTTVNQLHHEALAAFQRAGGRMLNYIDPAADVIIDGIFGTGFHGSFDVPDYLYEHDLQIPHGAAVIACDIASGVVADTGQIPGEALTADMTVTFGATKYGQLVGDGAQHAGQLRVVDIGIADELAAITDPWWLAETSDIPRVYGAPGWDVHKYSRGVVSVLAGSEQYPGAAVIVVNAVAATGTGYISLIADHNQTVANMVLAAHPQTVVADDVTTKATAIIVGPGLGDQPADHAAAGTALETARANDLPVLVDASGLDILDATLLEQSFAAMVLTPHVGEMQRLTKRLAPELTEHDPVDQAATFAKRFGVWIVLKSADTHVFAPQTWRSVHPGQTSDLATAGTGDTLAGILGAGMATLDTTDDDFQQQLFTVLAAGVRLHSLAGELATADGGVVVSDLDHYIRTAKHQAQSSH